MSKPNYWNTKPSNDSTVPHWFLAGIILLGGLGLTVSLAMGLGG